MVGACKWFARVACGRFRVARSLRGQSLRDAPAYLGRDGRSFAQWWWSGGRYRIQIMQPTRFAQCQMEPGDLPRQWTGGQGVHGATDCARLAEHVHGIGRDYQAVGPAEHTGVGIAAVIVAGPDQTRHILQCVTKEIDPRWWGTPRGEYQQAAAFVALACVQTRQQLAHVTSAHGDTLARAKRFIGELSGVADPAERRDGSLAAAVWCAAQGVDVVRVHDVGPTVQALRVADAIARGRP